MRPITVKFCVQAIPIQTPTIRLSPSVSSPTSTWDSFRGETAVRRFEQRRKFRNQPTAMLEITTPTFGAQYSLSLSLSSPAVSLAAAGRVPRRHAETPMLFTPDPYNETERVAGVDTGESCAARSSCIIAKCNVDAGSGGS